MATRVEMLIAVLCFAAAVALAFHRPSTATEPLHSDSWVCLRMETRAVDHHEVPYCALYEARRIRT